MASDVQSAAASKFVHSVMSALRNFIELGRAIVQLPPQQTLGKSRVCLDSVLSVGMTDWIQMVCQMGSETRNRIFGHEQLWGDPSKLKAGK